MTGDLYNVNVQTTTAQGQEAYIFTECPAIANTGIANSYTNANSYNNVTFNNIQWDFGANAICPIVTTEVPASSGIFMGAVNIPYSNNDATLQALQAEVEELRKQLANKEMKSSRKINKQLYKDVNVQRRIRFCD